MNDQYPQPKPLIVLDDLEILKVLADPLRNQIMEVLTPAPLTINQVAARLGEESSKLYYHFNLLEKNGLIHIVETNVVGNLIEKRYWITAYEFELNEKLLNFNVETPEGTEKIITMLLANINATRDDLRRSMYARHQQISQGAPQQPRRVLDNREILHLTDEMAAEFHKRLHDLLMEFKQESEGYQSGQEGVLPWALSIVFYPSFYYQQQESENE